jgi:hypothetical protein
MAGTAAQWDFLPQVQHCAGLSSTLRVALGNRMAKRGVSWWIVKILTKSQEIRQSVDKKYDGHQ